MTSLQYFMGGSTPLDAWQRYRKYRRKKEKHLNWQQDGAVLPMRHFGKFLVVKEYLEKSGLNTLIETGTYKGDMIYDLIPLCQKLYSIELSENYYLKAKTRFKKNKNVEILNGQSGELLPKLLQKIDTPCLFWLDAHYSGGKTAKGNLETPIIQELDCILKHQHVDGHVILIDDAREFTGQNDYPTMDVLEECIRKCCPGWVFRIEDDIIRTHSEKYHVFAESAR